MTIFALYSVKMNRILKALIYLFHIPQNKEKSKKITTLLQITEKIIIISLFSGAILVGGLLLASAALYALDVYATSRNGRKFRIIF